MNTEHQTDPASEPAIDYYAKTPAELAQHVREMLATFPDYGVMVSRELLAALADRAEQADRLPDAFEVGDDLTSMKLMQCGRQIGYLLLHSVASGLFVDLAASRDADFAALPQSRCCYRPERIEESGVLCSITPRKD